MSNLTPRGDIPAAELAEYLRIYLEETGEQLDRLVEVLLALEADAADARLLAEAFRLVHSIKGSAALLGFDRITRLVHHLETHFERLRSGRQRYDAATTNVVLRCIDYLRECHVRLERGESLEGDAALVDAVQALAMDPPAAAGPAGDPPAAPDAPVAEEIPGPVGSAPGTPAAGASEPERRVRVTVRFEPGQPLAAVRAELVRARLAGVGRVLAASPGDTGSLVVELATAAGTDAVRGAASVDGAAAIGVEPLPPEASTPVARGVEEPPATEAAPATGDAGRAATLRVDVARLDGLLNLAGELLLQRSRFARVVADLAPVFHKAALPGQLAAVADGLREIVGRLEAGAPPAEVVADLVARLALLDEQLGVVRDGQRQVARLVENTDRLARLSDQVQRGVLRTRMVPVAPLFNRFRRSVRDIAAELGKQVSLELAGEQTELDKRTIDELGDPLVHLVRNAIDHGIEPPEERLARGKPPLATLTLGAAHRGNAVMITVRDDGRGIDTARIRQRIIDRGLLPAEQASQLGADELIDTIWEPGFSTAREVSGISGRGVGMDIVRTRIAALGGTIEVVSAEGVGTTFVIRLPLTLAIAHCLLFGTSQGIFAASLDDVREIVSLGPDEVVDVRGRRACEVRGRFLPLVTIDDVFRWPAAPPRPPRGAHAVVLQSGPRAVALAVDELVGREDLVVKSLADNFVPLRGLGGAGVLGDGSVCLLLDVATIIGAARLG